MSLRSLISRVAGPDGAMAGFACSAGSAGIAAMLTPATGSPTCKTPPPEVVVPPVKAFAPVRSSVPLPAFTRPPAAEMEEFNTTAELPSRTTEDSGGAGTLDVRSLTTNVLVKSYKGFAPSVSYEANSRVALRSGFSADAAKNSVAGSGLEITPPKETERLSVIAIPSATPCATTVVAGAFVRFIVGTTVAVLGR